MIRKLRIKFIMINMVIVTAILTILFVLLMVFVRQNLYHDSMHALTKAVTLNGIPTSNMIPDFEEDGKVDLLGEDTVPMPYLTVQMVNEHTLYILANHFFDTDDTESLYEAVSYALAQEEDTGIIKQDCYHMRFLKYDTSLGTRIAFVNLMQEESTINALLRTLIIVGIIALFSFFFISMFLARWAVRPVEKSWDQQRQFVSDASHELKTPLAVISSSLDLLETPDTTEDCRKRWLENVRVSSNQMQTLVEELLVLARSDNATQKVNFTDCDLSDIVASSTLLFEPIAFEKGILFDESIPEGISVNGDAALLKRLIDIYLDNACKYSSENSTISVSLSTDSKKAILCVHSQGTPIDEDKLDKIFERFYRIDSSRTEEGYGLGLSIAFELARIHKGKVWAKATPDGNSFFFSLPLK